MVVKNKNKSVLRAFIAAIELLSLSDSESFLLQIVARARTEKSQVEVVQVGAVQVVVVTQTLPEVPALFAS